MAYDVTLLPGDGIGPEVTEATLNVLEAVPVEFNWDRHRIIGTEAVEQDRPALPEDVVESIERTHCALKGPITTPVGEGFMSVNVQLRQEMDLYANIRPCRSLPGVEDRFPDVDLVIFRENTEGLYSGIENYDKRLEIADSINRITRKGSERIIRACFEWAQKNDRDKVTLVHKANILKKSSGMFLEIGREIAEDYGGIEFNDRIIDNMCMQLVQRPEEYDCIVTTNLFGDIISDLAAALVGGLGVVPGANIGDDHAVFEAVHGSAPDIAGKGVANPTAMILTSAMMLEHLGESEVAQRIEEAVEGVYRDGEPLTPDMGGSATTMEWADHLSQQVSRRF
jgi:isocitrate dehydrogenase (NAD+)